MPLADPLSWSVLPYGDETAWTDFLGAHDLWHVGLDARIHVLSPTAIVRTITLGDGGGDEWASAHQARHDDECAGLGITPGPDFQSYDLTKADQFASWAFQHAYECRRLAQAAGL